MTLGSMAKGKTLSTRPEVAGFWSASIQLHAEGHIPSKTWFPILTMKAWSQTRSRGHPYLTWFGFVSITVWLLRMFHRVLKR